MSTITGIGGAPRIPLAGTEERPVRPGSAEAGRAAPPPPATPEPTPPPESGEAVPAEPPAGVDPSLWTILTSEERRFFARARALGPLTYGPRAGGATPAAPAPGGRLDVRV